MAYTVVVVRLQAGYFRSVVAALAGAAGYDVRELFMSSLVLPTIVTTE